MSDLPGFVNPNKTIEISNGVDDRVKKKTYKKSGGGGSGGFQSMGLNFNILSGIMKRGYKQPTPIQRKTIPLVLEGRDVVAMARTGSGKTACFLIPMFEKLKIRSAKAGARALIFSPTRELALQTLKFIKEIGRFTNLKASVILGGDSMDDQFSAIHGNPDIIVATPGRFLHVCIEMDLKLDSIEYVVFDEADRLFEMGLGEQLQEIINRLPDSKQTVLFSATLPKILVDFAKAGLSDPTLIRLDVESKIPEELQLWFVTVRAEERLAALLVLLKNHIDNRQQTVVFAATKHHVEYLHMILDCVGISNTYIYSDLDASARKIHAAKFSTGKVKVLIVTDIAARGIDIPQLDNVINFNFPSKSKLFVHRVGRCARAGRSGTAYSLIGPDEYAHLLDLHLFLGRPLSIITPTNRNGTIGKMPQYLLEDQHTTLLTLHENRTDLISLRKVTENAYQHYLKSRPAASADSNRRIKDMPFNTCSIHTIFKQNNDELVEKRENMIDSMKNYRPQGTIFEICGKNKSQEYLVMKEKRSLHKDKISVYRQIVEQKQQEFASNNDEHDDDDNKEKQLLKSNVEDIENTFNKVIVPKKRKLENLYKKNKKQKDENYIPYVPNDQHTEEGLAVKNFQNEANRVQFDLTGDSEEMLKRSAQIKKWDRKKKKMVSMQDKRVGKIQTESGVWIPASYKGTRYAQWKEKSKIAEMDDDNNDNDGYENTHKPTGNKQHGRLKERWIRHNEKLKSKQRRSELKTTDQIMKARKIAEKKQNRQKRKPARKSHKKTK